MRKYWIRIVLVGLLLFAAVMVLQFLLPEEEPTVQAGLVSTAANDPGFKRVEGSVPLSFPRDHGPHPEYQTEWWYYTGNIETEDERHFGYQLTFFRRGAVPQDEITPRESSWAVDQVYMAHFAVTDVGGKDFRSFERLSRGAAGLAGAAGEPEYEVWLEDWRVEQTGPDEYHLSASQHGVEIDLSLTDRKGPVLQGLQGYSRKGPEPGNASIYYSQTRLETQGFVRIGGENFSVSGLSWMDHEISTSALSKGQVGWDWFSLQMSDGAELMMFHIRREDGSVDPFSSGSYIRTDGSVETLSRDDFVIEPAGVWRSPRSGAEYPSGWEIRIAKLGIRMRVDPFVTDQEHALSYAYWEGAVRLRGERHGQTINGSGYAELTGYADRMEGDF